LAGLAALFPIFITAYLVMIIFRFAEHIAGGYVNSFMRANYGFTVPGLGIVFTLLIIIFIGMVSMHVVGRKVLPVLESMLFRVPLIKNIYTAAKQLSDFLFGQSKRMKLGKVVMVEYPTAGLYAIGFLTNEELSVFSVRAGRELVSVLLSTPPSPWSGFLVLVPKDKVMFLDITMEDAVAFFVSAGLAAPRAAGGIAAQ